jgi:hypothetical protein
MSKLVLNFKTLFVVVLAAMVLTSCSEDEKVVQTADLIGAWEIESTSVDVSVGEQTMKQYMTEVLELTVLEAEAMNVLMIEAFEEDALAGTIELKDDNTYTSSIGVDAAETGTWALSADGKELTLTPDIANEEETVLDVVSANSSSLVVSFAEEMLEDLDDDGTEELLIINMTINLAK